MMTLRRKLLFSVALSATFILGCRGATSSEQAIIKLDPKTTYQTITGWEAGAQIGQSDFPNQFQLWKDIVADLAVNELGINRVRLGISSGVENTQDHWSDFQAGRIDRATLRCVRYSTINDNNDPFVINWSGFHFSALDQSVENVVLPLKRRLEANGEKLYINLTYTAFTGQICGDLKYHHDSPEEYAEVVLATYLHLKNKYHLIPDAWNMILEPDNTRFWRGMQIGNAIVAAANRLKAHGFTPRFIAPSTTDMRNAASYFDAMIQVAGVLEYLAELSYHRYRGVSDATLAEIANRAVKYGINTAMLEHIGSGHEDLHKDLKIGRNSAWQQFTLAYPGTKDNGGAYYRIDNSNPDNPRIIMGSRTKFLRQYFKYIRSGAVRMETTTNNNDFDPLAFMNTNSKYVVVVKANRGGSFAIRGLPARTYGITYTTPSQYDVHAADVTISSGQALNASIPERGVITAHARVSTGPDPPALLPQRRQ